MILDDRSTPKLHAQPLSCRKSILQTDFGGSVEHYGFRRTLTSEVSRKMIVLGGALVLSGCQTPVVHDSATVGGVRVHGTLRITSRRMTHDQAMAVPPGLDVAVVSRTPQGKRFYLRLTSVTPASAGAKLLPGLSEPPSDPECRHTYAFFSAPASSIPQVTVKGELFELDDHEEPIVLRNKDRRPFAKNTYGPAVDFVDGTTPSGVKVRLMAAAIGDNPPVVWVYLKDPQGVAGKDGVHWLDVSHIHSPTIDHTIDAYLTCRHFTDNGLNSPSYGYTVVAEEQGAGVTRAVLNEDFKVVVRQTTMKSLGKFELKVPLDTSPPSDRY